MKKGLQKIGFVLITLAIICPQIAVAKRFSLLSNVSPTRGIVGITIGGSQALGGDGQLFGTNEDSPHGDFGLVFGFDYWKRNLNSFDYHIALNAKYIQYHFHHVPTGEEEQSGYFRMLYYSIPFTVHFPIPNYPYLQFFGGLAVAGKNLLPTQTGNLSSFTYQSNLDLKWVVSPELILGVNLIEEKTDYFIVRGSINYSNFLLRNQLYDVSLSDDTQQLESSRRMNTGKFEFQITLYPKWKFKRALGKKDGINCPSPF